MAVVILAKEEPTRRQYWKHHWLLQRACCGVIDTRESVHNFLYQLTVVVCSAYIIHLLSQDNIMVGCIVEAQAQLKRFILTSALHQTLLPIAHCCAYR
jgi:hypothetical protein